MQFESLSVKNMEYTAFLMFASAERSLEKTRIPKGCIHNVQSSTIYRSWDMESASNNISDGEIDKEDMVHIYSGIFLSHKYE